MNLISRYIDSNLCSYAGIWVLLAQGLGNA